MPSPAAVARTAVHRRQLAVVAAATTSQIRRLAATAEPADIDSWWDRRSAAAARIVTAGFTVAADLAARYLADHARIEDVTVLPQRAEVNLEEITTSLLVTGPVAFKTHMRISGSETAALLTMRSRLTGAAERHTLRGDRNTVMGTFAASDELVGWRRVSGGRPCAFCAMLVGRGAVYSKGTADFPAHDHCACSAEPLYEREPEPASAQRLRDEWDEVTAGASGEAKLTAWRTHWAAKAAAA